MFIKNSNNLMCASGQETVYFFWILDGCQYDKFHVNAFN